jgi:hypothetical protein
MRTVLTFPELIKLSNALIDTIVNDAKNLLKVSFLD